MTIAVERVDWLSNYNLVSLIRLWINSSRAWKSGDFPVSGSLSDCISVGVFWRAAIWAWSWLLRSLNSSYSWMTFSRSRAACSDHDLTGLIALSSALSNRRGSKGAGLRVLAVVGHWWLPPKMKRGQCSRGTWLNVSRHGGQCPQWCWWLCP